MRKLLGRLIGQRTDTHSAESEGSDSLLAEAHLPSWHPLARTVSAPPGAAACNGPVGTPETRPTPSGPTLRLAVIADTDHRPESLAHASADILVSLGDISDNTIEHFAERLGNPPTLVVRGNHDVSGPVPNGWTDMHGRTFELLGIRFGGFGGCMRYRALGAHQYDEEEVEEVLEAMPPVDVFLGHNCPAGVHERGDHAHIGFRSFRRYLERHQPGLFLHGHQHVDTETRVGRTWVVGTYGHRFIEVARAAG